MAGSAPKQEYTSLEACRLLAIPPRRLRSWQKQGLIEPRPSYGFFDLIALRTLARLHAEKVPNRRIQQALAALREKLHEVKDPLTELRFYVDSRKVRVQVGGHTMEPLSGQLLLDFQESELQRMVAFPPSATTRSPHQRRSLAEEWFQKGLELEYQGAPVQEALDAYQRALELDESHPGVLVNLGTIYFSIQDWKRAEAFYRRAIKVSPDYALAHFNLGNLFDELGDRERALSQYQAALRIQPNYADVHYNIALLYQVSGQSMRALQHWKHYLKLDPASSWSVIARRELERLRQETVVDPTLPQQL